MVNLNYQMVRIVYPIFKIISNTLKKNTDKRLIKHPYKYTGTKLKKGLHLKLTIDIVLKF